ncbi:MAG: hypothetical protein V7L31_09610 [Nostoc sp.]
MKDSSTCKVILHQNIAPQRLTVRVATGASTRATLRGNTLYLMPND